MFTRKHCPTSCPGWLTNVGNGPKSSEGVRGVSGVSYPIFQDQNATPYEFTGQEYSRKDSNITKYSQVKEKTVPKLLEENMYSKSHSGSCSQKSPEVKTIDWSRSGHHCYDVERGTDKKKHLCSSQIPETGVDRKGLCSLEIIVQ